MSSIIISAILILAAFVIKAQLARDPNIGRFAFLGFLVPIIIGVLILGFSVTEVVPTGQVGIQVLFGKPLPGYLETGFNIISPLVNVHDMSIQTEAYTMSGKTDEGEVKGNDAIQVHGNDQLTLTVEATVLYHVDKTHASDIYQNVGDSYADKIIRPEARSVITTVATLWSGIELYSTHRQDYQDSIISRLRPVLESKGIALEQVLIRDVQPPQQLTDAINKKKQAEQEAEQMEYTLQKESKEAERKRIEAQGIHDFQTIVSSGISEPLLKWKGIEATEKLANSQNTKVIVIGSGKEGLPLILGGN